MTDTVRELCCATGGGGVGRGSSVCDICQFNVRWFVRNDNVQHLETSEVLLAVQRLIVVKVKVKVTLVQALRLCTGHTAHKGSRGIALPFHDHGTRRGLRGQRHAPAALYPREDSVPIVQEAGWAPGPVWTGAENLAPHRDSIPGPSSP